MPKDEGNSSRKGLIAVSEIDKVRYYNSPDYKRNLPKFNFKEEFMAEIEDEEVKFPKDLGAEHPFNFKAVEDVFKRCGIVSGGINKYVDHIVGEFSLKVKNPNAQKILDDFRKNSKFGTVLRQWVTEGLGKGNGFMEIDFKKSKVRTINANGMYIKRNKKGEVIKYNQFTGNLKRFVSGKSKVISFEPNQILHLPINMVANEAYGLGYIWPNERTIENLITAEQDVHKLVSRKAGAPIHVQAGPEGESVQSTDLEAFKSDLQYMTTRTEWVTDGNVKMNVLNFGELGKSLFDILTYDIEQLAAGMEIPVVLFGKGNIPEGLADAQDGAFLRKIAGLQDHIESILEEGLFRPLLRANGFDETVEFVWNLPSEDDINNRIQTITNLLSIVSPVLRSYLELELAKLMNIEGAEKFLIDPSDAQKEAEQEKGEDPERKKEEESIPQPEVPGVKPNAKESLNIKEDYSTMSVKEFVNLQEFSGFTYTDYLIRILQKLAKDNFTTLRAITKEDLRDGLLSISQVDQLRLIMKDGFQNNRTIREIEDRIINELNLKDRTNDGRLIATAVQRANSIARTETVRISNEALIELYKDNGISKYRFLAAVSDRTCPICLDLNGRVFDIKEATSGVNEPPMHTSCRCSTIAIVE